LPHLPSSAAASQMKRALSAVDSLPIQHQDQGTEPNRNASHAVPYTALSYPISACNFIPSSHSAGTTLLGPNGPCHQATHLIHASLCLSITFGLCCASHLPTRQTYPSHICRPLPAACLPNLAIRKIPSLSVSHLWPRQISPGRVLTTETLPRASP
jgi:hypothetical protein